ncbi:MAG: hypothetical protein AABX01_04315 [Candidatus Micrarchaeota archaeon]
MFKFSFLEIRKVKPKEDTKWAVLAYVGASTIGATFGTIGLFLLGLIGAFLLLKFGNPFQQRHAKFAMILDSIGLVLSIIGYYLASSAMESNNISILLEGARAMFIIGSLVILLYCLYAAYLSVTSRYVAVPKYID